MNEEELEREKSREDELSNDQWRKDTFFLAHYIYLLTQSIHTDALWAKGVKQLAGEKNVPVFEIFK